MSDDSQELSPADQRKRPIRHPELGSVARYGLPPARQPSPWSGGRPPASSNPASGVDIAETGIGRQLVGLMQERMMNEGNFRDIEDDELLLVLGRVIQDLKEGKSVSDLEGQLNRFVSEQDSRLQLVATLMTAHQLDRLQLYMNDRWKLERFLHERLNSGALSATEALSYYNIIRQELVVISAELRKPASPVEDVGKVLDRVDYTRSEEERAGLEHFEGTTSQGLEVIRRLTHKVQKVSRKVRQKLSTESGDSAAGEPPSESGS